MFPGARELNFDKTNSPSAGKLSRITKLVGCRRDDARNSRLAVPSSSERLEAKKPSG